VVAGPVTTDDVEIGAVDGPETTDDAPDRSGR
jgi:hypothetical protein